MSSFSQSSPHASRGCVCRRAEMIRVSPELATPLQVPSPGAEPARAPAPVSALCPPGAPLTRSLAHGPRALCPHLPVCFCLRCSSCPQGLLSATPTKLDKRTMFLGAGLPSLLSELLLTPETPPSTYICRCVFPTNCSGSHLHSHSHSGQMVSQKHLSTCPWVPRGGYKTGSSLETPPHRSSGEKRLIKCVSEDRSQTPSLQHQKKHGPSEGVSELRPLISFTSVFSLSSRVGKNII